jgi:1-deoxy-D-xylulose-5-phosphate reductoisomerase
MVEFVDGSVLAQLSVPDMRLPIQYALTFPKRLPSLPAQLDFYKITNLEFIKPNFQKFPCLKLAYQAIRKGGAYPCVLNAANEVAVESFLSQAIEFSKIPRVITKTLKAYQPKRPLDLKQLIEADKWARSYTKVLISKNLNLN